MRESNTPKMEITPGFLEITPGFLEITPGFLEVGRGVDGRKWAERLNVF